MLKFSNIIVLLGIAVVLGTATRTRQRRVNFDDYLISAFEALGQQENTTTTTTTPPSSQGRRQQEPTDRVTDLDILGYFRDVPRQHWSCCMLGKLAGDKGFHCHAAFYASRIARRNNNRAHNQKMMFHGPHAIRNWGRDIMSTFSRCVSPRPEEFHRCCTVATTEVKDRRVWRSYRN